jgi:hypothetical protein
MSVVAVALVLGALVILLLRTSKLGLGSAVVCTLFGLVLAITPVRGCMRRWTPRVPGCGARWARCEPTSGHPEGAEPAAAQHRQGARPAVRSAGRLARPQARPGDRRFAAAAGPASVGPRPDRGGVAGQPASRRPRRRRPPDAGPGPGRGAGVLADHRTGVVHPPGHLAAPRALAWLGGLPG